MKKKKILLIVLLAIMILILPGAIYYKIQMYRLTYLYTYFNWQDEDYSTKNQSKIDILKYDLSFDLYPEKKMFIADAIITGYVKDTSISTIELNFYDNFTINKITINDSLASYINEDKRLSIPYNQSIGRNFKIEVDYEGTPEKVGLDGFAFGKRNGQSLVYNLSEPNYASSWFPCNDVPFDKTLLDMRITNDSSAISVSNGNLVEVSDNGSRRTYHWRSEYPISTYLVAIYSSDYHYFFDKYVSLNGEDTMKVEFYVMSDQLKDAKIDFSTQVKMIEHFAKLFGEYPFIKEKYGIAEFLWNPGAMEHQTITGVSSKMISGNKNYEDTYAHELAHQWWGDAVSLKFWKDIWLNEGFATYSEALYYESLTGKKALQSTMMSKFSKKFSGTLAEPGSFLFTRTVYDKGAWALHMLRWEVGDSNFFKILRDYYEKYKYSNASTQDFKAVCENVSGKNLDKFFDQWINGEGQINLDYNKFVVNTDSGYSTQLNLEQVQDEYDEYHFPLQVRIIFSDSTSNEYRYNILNKDTVLNISTKKYPVSVELDPDNWLLANIRFKDE